MLRTVREKLRFLSEHAKASLLAYTLCSYLAYALIINFAVLTQPSWFRVLYYLCYKKLAVLLLCNSLGATVALLGHALLRCTLGHLRELETESLIEAGKTMLLDIILFLVLASPTVNGAEVYDGLLLFCLTLLLGVKLLHFVASHRTTHLMEAGVNGPQSVGKLAAFVSTLALFDVMMVLAFYSVASFRSNFYMWMLFEFVGVLLSASANLFKLSIVFVDASLEASDPTEQGWPLKNEFIFVAEVVRDMTELVMFLIFLGSFFLSNPARLPVYLANDLYQVARALITRLQAFNRYRKLSAKLDTDFPDATLAELVEADNCIICRDLLTIGAKRLPCSHVLHLECLRSWFVHHQTCPTCRAEVPMPSAQSRPRRTAPAEGVEAAPTATNDTRFAFSGETVVRGTTVSTLKPAASGGATGSSLQRAESIRAERAERKRSLYEGLALLLLEDAKLRTEIEELRGSVSKNDDE